MSKKVLMLTVTFLLVSMFSTSIILTAQAVGNGLTIDAYSTTPSEDPSTLTNMEDLVTGSENYICDGTIRVAHGTLRKYDYTGPLGTGTLYLETLHNKTNVEIPYSLLIGIGQGVYQYTLEITTDGGYGTGTLKGIGKLNWEYDITEFRFETWDTAKLVPVNGNLNLKWVSIEGCAFLFDWWWTATKVVS
jgi:hypothetical protein